MEKIVFVGLGAMGLPMARNLVKKGFVVRGCDTSPKALETLRAAGGRVAEAVADAAADADVSLVMVVNAAQAEAVLFGAGTVEALPVNAIVCLMAICPPGSVEKIARCVEATGRRFVDARFRRYGGCGGWRADHHGRGRHADVRRD